MNPLGTIERVGVRSNGVGRTAFRPAICVAAVLAVTAVLLAVPVAERTLTAALTFLFVVLIGSAAWGFRYALVLSFLAAIGFTLIVPPVGTFTFDDPRDAVALVAFLSIGIATSRLSDRVRREALNAEQRRADAVAAQEALRRSEAHLVEAQLASHTGSFSWRVATGQMFWSAETLRILEYDLTIEPSVEAVLRRTHPEDVDRVQQILARASEIGEAFDFEHRLLMPDGSVKHLHIVGHASRDGSGSVEFVGAVVDVTAAKRASEKLRQDEMELQHLVDVIPQHVIVLEPDGEILYVNRRDLDYTGLTMEDVQAPGYLARVVHPDDLKKFRNEREEAVARGIPWDTEARLLGKDGQYRWFLIRINPLRDEEGRIIRWYGTRTDIEEMKRANLALHEREAEIQKALDLIPQIVTVLAPGNMRIPLYLNRSGLDYLGVTLEEFQSRGAPGFYHPEDREGVVAESKSKFLSGAAHVYEARVRGKDGEYRWFLVRFSPLKDEAGRITRWYASATDIEDRKQAEERLARENVSLRQEIAKTSMFEEIVGTSAAFDAVLSRISRVAPTDSTVLITGETGTGKELIARAIHKRSPRSARAFVSVNCAAIPPALIGSELFGHEKGAFTGALQRHLGRFEIAEGGTIFLDEIGDLPPETQIALLRVLQEREIQRVGGTRPIPVDVRVIAATNRDLQAAIDMGAFRSDLFYRLNVFPIEVPPLRQRREDIPLLVEYFVHRFSRKSGKVFTTIGRESLDRLQTYSWPGNIRELQNVVERSVIVCDTEVFLVDESWLSRRAAGGAQAGSQRSLRDLASQEKEIIESALAETRGRVSGPAGAAARLGIPSTTLESKIKALEIKKHLFKAR